MGGEHHEGRSHNPEEAFAEAIMRGAAQGGAQRQGLAAAAAALWRLRFGSEHPGESADTMEEVAARLKSVQPALAQLVAGKQPTGDQKAMRNVALHALLGQGAEALPSSARAAKQVQRGGRRKLQEHRAAPTAAYLNDKQQTWRNEQAEVDCKIRDLFDFKREAVDSLLGLEVAYFRPSGFTTRSTGRTRHKAKANT